MTCTQCHRVYCQASVRGKAIAHLQRVGLLVVEVVVLLTAVAERLVLLVLVLVLGEMVRVNGGAAGRTAHFHRVK